jgi:hypothetical protein
MTITQVATRGHSSPHFRFGRVGFRFGVLGYSLDDGDCIVDELRIQVRGVVLAVGSGSAFLAFNGWPGYEVASTDLELMLDDFDQMDRGA